MPRLSPVGLLQAVVGVLLLLATAWLLWPWQGGAAPSAFFVPTASATPTRPVLATIATPTTFIPTPTTPPVVHVVQKGEVLGIIANQYGTTTQSILEANGLTDPDLISVGQELTIPDAQRTPPVTVVSTPWPTRTPTSALLYAAPVPIVPRDGEVFHGQEAHIRLGWTAMSVLREAEWYEIRLWSHEQGEAHALRFWSKASSCLVPASVFGSSKSGLFHWSVLLVRRTRGPAVLSPPTEERRFFWY